MPSALSLDLRSRIVSACRAGELTQVEIAEIFQVHLKTVEKLWQHFRRIGSAEAKPHGGGVRRHAGPDTNRTCAAWSLSRAITPWPSMSLSCGSAIRLSPACPCSRARSKLWVCRRKKVAHSRGTKSPGNGTGAAALSNQTEPGTPEGSGLCRGKRRTHRPEAPLRTSPQRRARARSGAARSLESAHHFRSPFDKGRTGEHDGRGRHRCRCLSHLCAARLSTHFASRPDRRHGQPVAA